MQVEFNTQNDHENSPQQKPFTPEEEEKRDENEVTIRTDRHNIRLDKNRGMYFFLPKDHPDYQEQPEYAEENNICSCCIL